jgi:hypothetical protein
MGQLKFAAALARAPVPLSVEAASGRASAAFEQQEQRGGIVAPVGDTLGSNPASLAPAIGGSSLEQAPEEDPGGPIAAAPIEVPDAGSVRDITPYQNDVDQARQLSDQARSNDSTGTSMILAAGAMIAAAGALMKSPWTIAAGIALLAAGLMMMMMGKGKKAKAKEQAQQAGKLGAKVGEADGQQKQSEIIQADAAAAAKGKKAAPPPYEPPPSDLREAIKRQREATYVVAP